jgi:hypothetical protein
MNKLVKPCFEYSPFLLFSRKSLNGGSLLKSHLDRYNNIIEDNSQKPPKMIKETNFNLEADNKRLRLFIG